MYFAFAAIYYVLVLAFIVDVLRQPVERAVWSRQGAVDRRLPRHSRDRVACLRLLAHQAVAPVEGALTLTVLNPATEEPIAELEQAGVEETDEAVARAKEAFPAWRSVSPADRGRLLRRSRRWSRRTPRSSRGSSRRTSESRSPERAARSAWSRRSSTSTPEPSTSTAARRSPSRAASRRRSASRSASSGSSSRGTSPRTSRAGSSGRRSRAGTRSSSSRPS